MAEKQSDVVVRTAELRSLVLATSFLASPAEEKRMGKELFFATIDHKRVVLTSKFLRRTGNKEQAKWVLRIAERVGEIMIPAPFVVGTINVFKKILREKNPVKMLDKLVKYISGHKIWAVDFVITGNPPRAVVPKKKTTARGRARGRRFFDILVGFTNVKRAQSTLAQAGFPEAVQVLDKLSEDLIKRLEPSRRLMDTVERFDKTLLDASSMVSDSHIEDLKKKLQKLADDLYILI